MVSETYFMSGPGLLKVFLFTFIYQTMQAQEIQVGHIRANNYDFTYLEAGKGPLVLLFHGFPDNPYTFTSQIKALAAAGYHAVAPYKRGFSPGDTVLNPVQHASLYMQDAAALVDALKEDKVIVIGHDWGAGAAYGLAKLVPSKVKAMITMAVPLSPAFFASFTTNPHQMKRSWYLFYFQAPYAVDGLRHNDFAMIDFLWQSWCPGWKNYKEHLQLVKETFRKKNSAEAAVEYYRQTFGNYQLTDPELQKIQGAFYDGKPFSVPTLYMHGQNDGCIGAENAESMEQLFAGRFEKHIIPDAGHFIHMEKADVVNGYLLDFLKRLK